MNTMSVKQTLKCSIHSPEKWQEDYNGYDADNTNNLPNLDPVKVYAVDDYPACPDNWMHGSDIVGSYFVGLAEDGALWLDLNECFDHTHDVAVVLSVQGINPITGQTMVGDNPLRMEQYHKNCPVHNIPFKQDYFCEECGYSWPGQNYMATTGTPFGMFWIDGFRTPDGKVRQYVISAEKMRSVAAQVMEKRGEDSEDRVFAIGVAFYLSKDKKPEMPKSERQTSMPQNKGPAFSSPMFFSPLYSPQNWNGHKKGFVGGQSYLYGSTTGSSNGSSVSSSNTASSSSIRAASVSIPNEKIGSIDHDGIAIYASLGSVFNDTDEMITTNHAFTYDDDDGDMAALDLGIEESIETVTPVKKLEVGAGALVSQRIYDDPKNLKKYWEETPAGMIYINYCDEETLKKILDGGKKATKKDGFMDGVQVG